MKGMSWKVYIQFIVSSEMQLGSRLSYQIISTVFLTMKIPCIHTSQYYKSEIISFHLKKKQLLDIKATGKMLRR